MRKATLSCCLLLLAACGDEGGSTPADDASSDTLVDTHKGDEGGGDLGEPDVTPDPGPDSQPPADVPDTQDTQPDQVTPPAPDGKLGSPCQGDSDCLQDPEQVCFAGFCTRRCQQDGQLIPNACGDVSAASPFGSVWGCSDDIIYCMPGPVAGQDIICTADADCAAIAPNTVCAAAVLTGTKTVDGLCFPGGDREPAGEACASDGDCKSLLCQGEGEGTAGTCTAHCSQNKHCPASHLCVGFGFITEEDSETAGAWGGLCQPLQGGLNYCTSQDKCGESDICEVFVEPTTLKAQTWCVLGEPAVGQVGEACADGSDCFSGRCLLGGLDEDGIAGYCTQVCQKMPGDCGEGMGCASFALHGNGTPDNPKDDPSFGLCVFGASGDPCVLGVAGWCQAAGEVCLAGEGDPEGMGTCQAPPGCDAPGGEACDDGVACTQDQCIGGVCDFSALVADTCLIAGQCRAAGEANPGNPCEVCDPAVATDAWSPAAAGTACDDGDACTEGDQCDAGACVAGQAAQCDDGDACNGVETCDSATGCVAGAPMVCDDGEACTQDLCVDGACAHPPVEATCVIDGVCVPSGATNPDNACEACVPETAAEAWTPLDGTACDDGDACTEGDSCQAGACAAGDAVTCDDGDVCNGAETCDPATGCQAGTALVCDDGDACNGAETCDPATGCQAGTALDCDDGDACNGAESCDPATGCEAGTALVCDDDDACNGAESCDPATGCEAGTPLDCDDGIACTVDSCDAELGCQHDDSACAPAVPTYAEVQAEVLEVSCVPCHKGNTAGTCSGGACFVSHYSDTQKASNVCPGKTVAECMLSRVEEGSMPMGSPFSLSAQQHELLEAWVTGGAPN